MGVDAVNCRCPCGRDDKSTQKFDNCENIQHSSRSNNPNNNYTQKQYSKLNIDQYPDSNQNNLRSFVENKYISTNNDPQRISQSSISNKQYTTHFSDSNYFNYVSITRIQSVYRGYVYRKQYKSIRQEQIDETNKMLKELTEQYTRFNLKRAESLYGSRFNKDGWQSLYDTPSSVNHLQFSINYNYGRIFKTKLHLISDMIMAMYSGYVNIDNERHGYGVLLQNDGSKYEGHWCNNELSGWARMIDAEGTLYEGLFMNGKLNGKGIKKNLNGNIYIGDFIDHLREGKGKEETTEHIYEGEFKNDKKNGTGKLKYKILNDTYEGEFQDNVITGIGFYTWSNNDTYKGSFVNGKMHGKGLYKWPDGGEYYGDYINNIKEGNGVFKWVNGKVFEGPFKNGRPHGVGKLKTNNKEIEVEFKEGKLITNVKEKLAKGTTNRSLKKQKTAGNQHVYNNIRETEENEEQDDNNN